MIRIAICDDSEEQALFLYQNVLKYMKENKEQAEIAMYEKSQMLQYDIQDGKFFDMILTDIEMPELNGMELVTLVRNYLPEVLIIFVTSHIKYAVDAFEYSVFRYIPKNMLQDKLPQALKDALKMIRMQAEEYYMISMPNRMEKLALRKILYIMREGKNSVFYLADGTDTRERKSLMKVYQGLNSNEFVFADRGCIVNLAHIQFIRDTKIEMENGDWIQASRSRLTEIKQGLQALWGRQL